MILAVILTYAPDWRAGLDRYVGRESEILGSFPSSSLQKQAIYASGVPLRSTPGYPPLAPSALRSVDPYAKR